jgi:hypothetical protein
MNCNGNSCVVSSDDKNLFIDYNDLDATVTLIDPIETGENKSLGAGELFRNIGVLAPNHIAAIDSKSTLHIWKKETGWHRRWATGMLAAELIQTQAGLWLRTDDLLVSLHFNGAELSTEQVIKLDASPTDAILLTHNQDKSAVWAVTPVTTQLSTQDPSYLLPPLSDGKHKPNNEEHPGSENEQIFFEPHIVEFSETHCQECHQDEHDQWEWWNERRLEMYSRIRGYNRLQEMPKTGRLANEESLVVKQWLSQGARLSIEAQAPRL